MNIRPPDPPSWTPSGGKPGVPSWTPNPNPPQPPTPAPQAAPTNPWGGNTPRPPHLQAPSLDGRFGETEYANRITIRGRTLQEVTIDRPYMLVPIGVPSSVLYYQTKRRPTWAGAGGPLALVSDAPLKAFGPGNAYLSAPGTWFLFLDQSTGSSVDYAMVPCEDPGLAARYLGEDGAVTATAPVAGTLALGANATATIAANRDRTALLIQNTTAVAPTVTTCFRVGFGVVPAAGDPPVGNGILIPAGGSLLLSGRFNFKGAVILIGGSAATITGHYSEFV